MMAKYLLANMLDAQLAGLGQFLPVFVPRKAELLKLIHLIGQIQRLCTYLRIVSIQRLSKIGGGINWLDAPSTSSMPM